MNSKNATASSSNPLCIVTGAASGIGKATTLRFVREGFRVAAIDRSEEGLKELEASNKDSPISTYRCDLRDISLLHPLAQNILNELGPPMVLVNNAGVCLYADITATTEEHWAESLNVNLIAAATLVGKFVPSMKQLKGAAIVNVSSRNAVSGSPRASTYDAAKAGLLAMTRSLSVELGPSGIRVNAVLPGVIDTPIHKDLFKDQEFVSNYLKLIPLNRFGVADDIANLIFFLASDQAAFITGQGIVADGGQMSGQNYTRIFGQTEAYRLRTER